MEKIIFLSLPIEDLQTVIIDCVNSCLKNNTQNADRYKDNKDELFTVKEAAKFLSLSVPTIYGLVSKCQLPVSKRGKRLYFSQLELTNWIKEGRRKTNSEIANNADQYLFGKRQG